MLDQATSLRRMMADIRIEETPAHSTSSSCQMKTPRIIAVTGGKGGVGKTLTTANLGLCLCRHGMRTLLIDGDFGLANLDVVLNMHPKATLDDVLAGDCELREIMMTGPDGIRVVPAASGILRAPDLGRMEKLLLLDQLDSVNEEFDIILIDTAAGISRNVQNWTSSANEVVVVVTPEPTSLADGYATIKVLNQTTRETKFKLVVNMARNEEEGLKVFDRISTLAGDYLRVRVEYLGCIPFDEAMRSAVRERVPCVQRYPFSLAARGFRQMAGTLLADPDRAPRSGTVQHLWRKMMQSQGEMLV